MTIRASSRIRAAAGLAALAVLANLACNDAVKLEHFLQAPGPSFTVVNTFGQLIQVSPSKAAHYLAVQLAPPATEILTPSSGEIFYVDSLDGLSDCLVLKPKLRDDDDGTSFGELGPGLKKPDKLRLALCNLDHTGGSSPLRTAIQTLYTDLEADDPAAETTEFFDLAADLDDRKADVWAAPEAVFPDPAPTDDHRRWSRLGPAAGGVLHIGAYSEKDGHKTYLNPAPYLAKIPLSPPASALRRPTFAEIKLESAADAGFATSLRSYDVVGLSSCTPPASPCPLSPSEALGGFLRVFFRLTNNADDGGSTAVAAPYEIAYELRETGGGTPVKSHGRFFSNALATDAATTLATLTENLGDALYRTPGTGAPESNPGAEQLWVQLPLDPAVVSAGDGVPLHNLGDLGFAPALESEVEDAGVRRYPPGDYELEIVLASAFDAAVIDTKVVSFVLAGAPQVQLTAAHATDAEEETPGAPVRLNDDNDNANAYPDPSGAVGKRPFEPWFDLDETATVAGEDDLMQLTLDVVPHSLTGNATLTIPTGGARIKLWNNADKGPAADLVTVPAGGLAIPIANVPKTLWVEGIATGAAELHLEYIHGAATLEDTVDVHVVQLVEQQTWTDVVTTSRRVINRYATDIEFEVVGGTPDFEYRWDLNGDGDRATDPFETGAGAMARTRSVQYSTAADAAANVQLPAVAANRRQTYDVSVELTGGLVLSKTIRVALDAHHGTPLAGAAVADRQVEIAGLGVVPVASFDNAPAGAAGVTFTQAWHVATYGITLNINAGNRLQYAHLETANNAITTHNAFFPGVAAADRRVFFVGVGKRVYDLAQTQEDVSSSTMHENQHVNQVVSIRDNDPPGNVWGLLDGHFGSFTGYVDATEADGHFVEITDPDVGWFHLIDGGQRDLLVFVTRYNAAVGVLGTIPAGATFTAKEAMLRDWYQNLPFDEMKRTDYDQTVRPPP